MSVCFAGGLRNRVSRTFLAKKPFFVKSTFFLKKSLAIRVSCSDISPALFVRGGWSMRKKSRGENPPWQIYSKEGRVGLKKLAMGEGGGVGCLKGQVPTTPTSTYIVQPPAHIMFSRRKSDRGIKDFFSPFFEKKGNFVSRCLEKRSNRFEFCRRGKGGEMTANIPPLHPGH